MISDSESDSDHDHGPVQLEKRQIIPFTASAPCANRRRPAAGAVSPGPPTAVCRGGGPQAAAADTEAAARPANRDHGRDRGTGSLAGDIGCPDAVQNLSRFPKKGNLVFK